MREARSHRHTKAQKKEVFMRLSYLFRFLVGLALIASASTKALSEESFKGKNVKIIVPYSPGGGWDSYARMAGRYIVQLSRDLPKRVQELAIARSVGTYFHLVMSNFNGISVRV